MKYRGERENRKKGEDDLHPTIAFGGGQKEISSRRLSLEKGRRDFPRTPAKFSTIFPTFQSV